MIRERDDAVSTYVKSVETPVMPNPFVKQMYWDEVARQVACLIGTDKAVKLAKMLLTDAVMYALYNKSEQSRIDLIITLQRNGRL